MNEGSTINVEAPAKTGSREGKSTGPKPLPASNRDFYDLAATLNAEELAFLKQVRAFMETRVAVIINKCWRPMLRPLGLLSSAFAARRTTTGEKEMAGLQPS
jgi:hypothetical protein